MEIVTRYVADDGKEFTDKGECMHYETRKRAEACGSLIMFTEAGKLTTDSDKAWFAYFKNESARKIFYDAVTNDIGYNPADSEDIKQHSDPNETNMIFWDKDTEEWFCVKDYLKFARFMENMFKEYLKEDEY